MQTDRPISVSSPLGTDVLLFYRMTAQESLGRLFDFDLGVLSEDHNIKLEDLLGQAMTVNLDLPGGGKRLFHGIVSQLSSAGTIGRYAHYTIQLHPWLWFLTRTTDCRIFQEMTIPNIIKAVFRDFGFSDIEDSLSGSYAAWDYCVQYRETAFNFISRLMEQEGIYYYFKHEEDKHTLVLSDSYSSHATIAGYAEVPFFPPEENEESDLDRLLEWHISQQVQATSFTLNDYNFETPKSDIKTSATATKKHTGTDYKEFDYPGDYPDTGVGNEYVKYRMEELKAEYETYAANGTAQGLMAGCLFSLIDHPRNDQNKEYLVVAATHTLEAGGYESGDTGGGELTYQGSIEAIDAQVPYRTPRTTPKPLVQGPQTAVVVGPSGEEIWTDQYGRVKLQFHWDRYGESDENSSCWVRVAQVWAGKNWGSIHVPRIDQEVIVEFLEGDPDRPIITGRVYNADQTVPYGLPDNQTQSGIKSRSTKGGGGDNFNEIRMEDKMGEELLYIHAERDQGTVVENDQGIGVGNDRAEEIGRDRSLVVQRNKSEQVAQDKSITVGASHSEAIGSDMSVTIGANLTETVAINYAETVGAAMELSVGGALAITVGAAMSEAVGGVKSETIGSSKSVSVGSSLSETVGKDQTTTISGNLKQVTGKKRRDEIKEEFAILAKKVQVTADDEISLKTGKAELVMKKNGDVTIKGKKITVKGSGDVIIKGSKIKEN